VGAEFRLPRRRESRREMRLKRKLAPLIPADLLDDLDLLS
jgi:hypothetical protein